MRRDESNNLLRKGNKYPSVKLSEFYDQDFNEEKTISHIQSASRNNVSSLINSNDLYTNTSQYFRPPKPLMCQKIVNETERCLSNTARMISGEKGIDDTVICYSSLLHNQSQDLINPNLSKGGKVRLGCGILKSKSKSKSRGKSQLASERSASNINISTLKPTYSQLPDREISYKNNNNSIKPSNMAQIPIKANNNKLINKNWNLNPLSKVKIPSKQQSKHESSRHNSQIDDSEPYEVISYNLTKGRELSIESKDTLLRERTQANPPSMINQMAVTQEANLNCDRLKRIYRKNKNLGTLNSNKFSWSKRFGLEIENLQFEILPSRSSSLVIYSSFACTWDSSKNKKSKINGYISKNKFMKLISLPSLSIQGRRTLYDYSLDRQADLSFLHKKFYKLILDRGCSGAITNLKREKTNQLCRANNISIIKVPKEKTLAIESNSIEFSKESTYSMLSENRVNDLIIDKSFLKRKPEHKLSVEQNLCFSAREAQSLLLSYSTLSQVSIDAVKKMKELSIQSQSSFSELKLKLESLEPIKSQSCSSFFIPNTFKGYELYKTHEFSIHRTLPELLLSDKRSLEYILKPNKHLLFTSSTEEAMHLQSKCQTIEQQSIQKFEYIKKRKSFVLETRESLKLTAEIVPLEVSSASFEVCKHVKNRSSNIVSSSVLAFTIEKMFDVKFEVKRSESFELKSITITQNLNISAYETFEITRTSSKDICYRQVKQVDLKLLCVKPKLTISSILCIEYKLNKDRISLEQTDAFNFQLAKKSSLLATSLECFEYFNKEPSYSSSLIESQIQLFLSKRIKISSIERQQEFTFIKKPILSYSIGQIEVKVECIGSKVFKFESMHSLRIASIDNFTYSFSRKFDNIAIHALTANNINIAKLLPKIQAAYSTEFIPIPKSIELKPCHTFYMKIDPVLRILSIENKEELTYNKEAKHQFYSRSQSYLEIQPKVKLVSLLSKDNDSFEWISLSKERLITNSSLQSLTICSSYLKRNKYSYDVSLSSLNNLNIELRTNHEQAHEFQRLAHPLLLSKNFEIEIKGVKKLGFTQTILSSSFSINNSKQHMFRMMNLDTLNLPQTIKSYQYAITTVKLEILRSNQALRVVVASRGDYCMKREFGKLTLNLEVKMEINSTSKCLSIQSLGCSYSIINEKKSLSILLHNGFEILCRKMRCYVSNTCSSFDIRPHIPLNQIVYGAPYEVLKKPKYFIVQNGDSLALAKRCWKLEEEDQSSFGFTTKHSSARLCNSLVLDFQYSSLPKITEFTLESIKGTFEGTPKFRCFKSQCLISFCILRAPIDLNFKVSSGFEQLERLTLDLKVKTRNSKIKKESVTEHNYVVARVDEMNNYSFSIDSHPRAYKNQKIELCTDFIINKTFQEHIPLSISQLSIYASKFNQNFEVQSFRCEYKLSKNKHLVCEKSEADNFYLCKLERPLYTHHEYIEWNCVLKKHIKYVIENQHTTQLFAYHEPNSEVKSDNFEYRNISAKHLNYKSCKIQSILLLPKSVNLSTSNDDSFTFQCISQKHLSYITTNITDLEFHPALPIKLIELSVEVSISKKLRPESLIVKNESLLISSILIPLSIDNKNELEIRKTEKIRVLTHESLCYPYINKLEGLLLDEQQNFILLGQTKNFEFQNENFEFPKKNPMDSIYPTQYSFYLSSSRKPQDSIISSQICFGFASVARDLYYKTAFSSLTCYRRTKQIEAKLEQVQLIQFNESKALYFKNSHECEMSLPANSKAFLISSIQISNHNFHLLSISKIGVESHSKFSINAIPSKTYITKLLNLSKQADFTLMNGKQFEIEQVYFEANPKPNATLISYETPIKKENYLGSFKDLEVNEELSHHNKLRSSKKVKFSEKNLLAIEPEIIEDNAELNDSVTRNINFYNYFSGKKLFSPLGTIKEEEVDKSDHQHFMNHFLKKSLRRITNFKLYFLLKQSQPIKYYYFLWKEKCGMVIRSILGSSSKKKVTSKPTPKSDTKDWEVASSTSTINKSFNYTINYCNNYLKNDSESACYLIVKLLAGIDKKYRPCIYFFKKWFLIVKAIKQKGRAKITVTKLSKTHVNQKGLLDKTVPYTSQPSMTTSFPQELVDQKKSIHNIVNRIAKIKGNLINLKSKTTKKLYIKMKKLFMRSFDNFDITYFHYVKWLKKSKLRQSLINLFLKASQKSYVMRNPKPFYFKKWRTRAVKPKK